MNQIVNYNYIVNQIANYIGNTHRVQDGTLVNTSIVRTELDLHRTSVRDAEGKKNESEKQFGVLVKGRGTYKRMYAASDRKYKLKSISHVLLDLKTK